MPERRIYKRFPIALQVWCEGSDYTLMVQASNLSSRGLYLRTSNPPPPNTDLKVTIEQIDMVATAHVCWVHQESGNSRSGMGLMIDKFERGQEAFEAYLAECTSASGEFSLGLGDTDKSN